HRAHGRYQTGRVSLGGERAGGDHWLLLDERLIPPSQRELERSCQDCSKKAPRFATPILCHLYGTLLPYPSRFVTLRLCRLGNRSPGMAGRVVSNEASVCTEKAPQ